MRFLPSARLLLTALALAWSVSFLVIAFQKWRYESICAMACSPFIPPDLVEHYRRAFDWQTPLMLAALPVAVLVGVQVWRLLRRARPSSRRA